MTAATLPAEPERKKIVELCKNYLRLDKVLLSGDEIKQIAKALVESEQSLDAAIVRAERDAKRIDFMESKNCTVYKSMGGQYWVFVDETKERKGVIGKTLRAAIDAAMGAQ